MAVQEATVDDQGIDTFEEVKLLSDNKIESLYNVLHRPGGMIAGAAADVPVIQNPGIQVNQSAEGHLKLMAFYLRHQTRVDIVRKFCELRLCESTCSKAPT